MVAPLAELRAAGDARGERRDIARRSTRSTRGRSRATRRWATSRSRCRRRRRARREALLDAAGVAIEATAARELVAVARHDARHGDGLQPGQDADLDRERVADRPVGDGVEAGAHDSAGQQRAPGARAIAATCLTWPWWLRRPLKGDTFTQPLTEMVTGEDRLRDSGVEVGLRIGGVPITVRTGPIVYRYADAALGEVRRPVSTVPEISVLLEHEVEYARANAPFDRTIPRVRALGGDGAARRRRVARAAGGAEGRHGDASRVAQGRSATRISISACRGKLSPGRDSIVATATSHGESFNLGFVPIEYEHIRPLRAYRPSTVQIEAVNATFANLKIGYIRGVGDNVMPMLEELGLSVVELDPGVAAAHEAVRASRRSCSAAAPTKRIPPRWSPTRRCS